MLLTELMKKGTLENALRGKKPLHLSLYRRFLFAHDIISGLRYLHGRRIIHKDIKPDNLLITDSMRMKIGDLGITKAPKIKNSLNPRIGPVRYLP